MHTMAVLALEGVVGFDLTIPCQVFGMTRLTGGSLPYDVRVCGQGPVAATTGQPGSPALFQVQTPWDLEVIAQADTVVVPGDVEPPEEVLEMLRAAANRGARIASVCTGAFALAAAGLLDGHRATTHWERAAELARRYPRIDVDSAVLFVEDGQLLTSAGAAAGLDLCLHMVRSDFGSAVAADTARRVVMPLQRHGGQAQFIMQEDPAEEGVTLAPTLAWLEENLHRPLTLEEIARHADTSVRSLARHFQAQVGTTPLQWLVRARVHRAQRLLESTDLPVERVGVEAGFGSTPTFRQHFARQVGTSPLAYRSAFRARDNGQPAG